MDLIDNGIWNCYKKIKDDVEINLQTELRFAAELYEKAKEGLEDDVPPEPLLWLENGEKLNLNWTKFFVDLIAKLENENTKEDEKTQIKTFMKCATFIYMNLMSSIWINFEDQIKLALKISKEDK
jgi:hypothetical protein